MNFMKTSAAAGTFNVIHNGHARLLDAAFSKGDFVKIGITSDRMASAGRKDVVPLYLRTKALEDYLKKYDKPWELFVIEDKFGPRDKMDSVDVLVVSEETMENGRLLNADRRSRGVKELELVPVPLLIACDGVKISSRGILKGEYGRSGSADLPDIAVGSLNHVKVEAVRTVMDRIYGDVRITAVDADSGVPDQPFEGKTREGAVNRARNALGNHEMAVGIEAGVFEKEDGLYDIQYCAVIDRTGKLTVGMGMGFRYPDGIAELVRAGRTVGDAFHKVYGNTDIGKKQGAIGLLSKGLIDRKTLTEQSVTAAMIPRIWD